MKPVLIALLLATVLISCSTEYVVELPNGSRTTVTDLDDLCYKTGDTIGIAQNRSDWYITQTMKNNVVSDYYIGRSGDTIHYSIRYEIATVLKVR